MPATTPEAIARKKANRDSKKDIAREVKIIELGGLGVSVTYGEPLERETRNERVEYLLDLMYPDRHKNKEAKKEKRGRGRPRKYKTEEERKLIYAQKAKERYRGLVGYKVRGYDNKSYAHSKAPWAYVHTAAKTRADKRGIPFSLTPEDIMEIWTDHCPVLGIEFEAGDGYVSDTSRTLDRIVPELGYVKGNVAFISGKANRIKTDANLKEIGKVYVWLRKKLSEKC